MALAEKKLIVSIHDVTPRYSEEIERAVSIAEECGVGRFSLLAVPFHHGVALDSDERFVGWLDSRRSRGDEVVLHGWQHAEGRKPPGLGRRLRRMLLTRSEGEFLGIGPVEAGIRIDMGLDILKECGFEPRGFVAPAWLFEKNHLGVLKKRGFLYTTSLTRIFDIQKSLDIHAPCLVLKGGSRSLNRLARFYNNVLSARLAQKPVLRLAVHPADIRYGAEAWYRAIIPRLLEGRTATTYLQFVSGEPGGLSASGG
jgi:predicted deacetylase